MLLLCNVLVLFKILHTEHHSGEPYVQQKFIAYSSGGGKSKIRVPEWPRECPLQVADCSLYPQLVAGPGELFWASFMRVLSPFTKAVLYDFNIAPKAPTPTIGHEDFNIPVCGGSKQPIACGKQSMSSCLLFIGKEAETGGGNVNF